MNEGADGMDEEDLDDKEDNDRVKKAVDDMDEGDVDEDKELDNVNVLGSTGTTTT